MYTIQSIIALPLGTKVYRVWNGSIKSFTTLGVHPKYSDTYFYLIDGDDVLSTTGVFIKNNTDFWTDNYETAKEEMWRQTLNKVNSINNIYFEGSKSWNK